MSDAPLRVVMLSKACYVAAYRSKLEAMAAIPSVELTLVVPPYWRFGKRREPLEPGHDQGYRLVVRSPVLNGNHHLHWYPGIGRVLDEAQPALFHIDEEPYDAVTAHALAAARRRGIRSIFFTWQNLDVTYPLPFELVRKWTLANVDGAIAGNQDAAEILRRRGFAKPLVVLPQFGVDPDDFPFRPPRAGVPFRIGYAGRLWRGKGLDTLLEAAAGLDGDWTIELLGTTREEEPALRAQATQLGIADRLAMPPGRPSSEVAAFLRTLDVLILPSRSLPNWKEQFGRILVEAMASGVSVVGSDSGEIPFVIGDAGLIFPEGDAPALRGHLARLLEDLGLRQSLAERGRARVLARFTQQHIAEATVAFYREVLAARQPSFSSGRV